MQPPGPLTPARARNLPEVGRSAAQSEPQQPLTNDGPPLTATTRPATTARGTRNNEVPGPGQHRKPFS